MLRAHAFGTSFLAVAFDIAFRIPNMLRNLVAEGALAQSFIPLYDQYKDEKHSERQAAGVIICFVLMVLIVLTSVAWFFLPEMIPYLTNHPDFETHKNLVSQGLQAHDSLVATQVMQTEYTITLAQMLFPYIVFISISSLYMAIQYSHNIFWAGSLGPALLNIIILVTFGAYYFFWHQATPEEAIYVWAAAVLLAAVLQLAFQYLVVKKHGLSPRYSLRFRHPVIKGLFAMMLPALFGAAVQEIGQLIDIFLATSLKDEVPGAVSALNFSHRLVQLPLGIFGVAVATASLPQLSRLFNEKKTSDFSHNVVAAVRMNFFLLLPATLGLIFLAEPLVAILFEHGQFSRRSTEITAYALQFYAIGILGYSLQKLFMSALYAQKNSKIPAMITATVLVLNISVSISLMPFLQHGGLALGSAIAAFSGVIIYLVILYRRKMTIFSRHDLVEIAKVLLTNGLLALVLLLVLHYLSGFKIADFWLVTMIVPGAGILYFILSAALRVEEIKHLGDILSRLRQKLGLKS